ncbi:MAG TPA: hypothetical protein VI653_27035, partial [Steroidobacteraceae bacterium]
MRVLLRVLAGVGGTLLLVLAAILTVGTALAAPLGMLLMRRRAARLNRRLNRIASLVGAMTASSVAAVLLGIVFFAVSPPGTFQQVESQATEARTQATVKMPTWYVRMFPQAASTAAAN